MTMNDQAQQLRERLQQQALSPPIKKTRVITVTSGKGGVGKSNFSLNFALGLIDLGQKVVIIDVDLGLANLDILMGVTARSNVLEMIERGKSIWDIMEKGPRGLEYIAGGSGFNQIFRLDDQKLEFFFQQMKELQGYADTIILDTGAGISQETLRFALASDDVVLVTTPEPTALTDAYALVKVVQAKNPRVPFQLVVNRINSFKEGKSTADKISMVARQFLNVELKTLGFISDDEHVSKAVKKQEPFYLAYPRCQAALGIRRLAEIFSRPQESATSNFEGMRGFISHLKKWIG